MKLLWSSLAVADANAIQAYISSDSLAAAARVRADIAAAGERLIAFPLSGRSGRRSGTRELIVPRTPYVLVYRVQPQ